MKLNIGNNINPLNTELNPICHLLALLGTHHIFHISGLRVKRRRIFKSSGMFRRIDLEILVMFSEDYV
jgi:hypothetical protein